MRKLLLIIAAIAIATAAAAQEHDDYLDRAGILATVFRGETPARYTFAYNGTYYIDSPEFKTGEVFYNGKHYTGVFLNVDAVRQDLLVRLNSSFTPVAVNRNLVNYFTIDGITYVNLKAIGVDEAPEGFFRLDRDGDRPVLTQIRKLYKSHAGNHNGSHIGYYDPYYDEDNPVYFYREEIHYALEGDKLKRISQSAFKRAMKSNADGQPRIATLMQQWRGSTEAVAINEPPAFTGSIIRLPDDFFQEKPEATEDEPQDSDVTASYRNKIYVIGNGNQRSGIRVSGTVTDLETGEPIPGVIIFDENTRTHAESNTLGRYSITLPPGDNILHFSYEGKEDLALTVVLRSNGTLNVELPDRINLLDAVIVSAQSMANHRSTTLGKEVVNVRTLVKVPSAFGEGDILKAVLMLPGVKTVGEASGGFNVRGGSQDQNLVLFNGNTIYNPSHLFGLFSSFNPDIVENVELYKSSIPAQYGGRISSVLSVESKRGDTERLRGSLSAGVLTSRFHLEGPIGRKRKTSFIVGGRTTYSDWLLKRLPRNSYYQNGSAGFGDLNLGITHRFSPNSVLRLNGYYAADRFSFNRDTSFNYSNLNASAQYLYRGSRGNEFQISAGYDQFGNITGIHGWESGAFDLETAVRDVFLRSMYSFPAGNHLIRMGADVVGYGLMPGSMSPYGEMSMVQAKTLDTELAVEPAIFISDEWDINDKLSVEGGLRLNSFFYTGQSGKYVGPEIRLSARYSILSNLSIKAGVNTMRQNIHLISNTSSVSPMDTWKLSDGDIKPTTGWQAAGGVYWTDMSTGIDFSLEGYYKRTQNCLDYRQGAQLSMNENLAADLLPVFGKAYGVEALVKKTTGNLTGWASYSYSRSRYKEMEEKGFEAIAGGNWYNAPYDKPHEFKLVTNWAITHRYSLSANIDYSTGRPVTVPVGKYYMGGAWRFAYSERNSYRIPDYFRMDLAFNIDPGHKKTDLVHTSITLGVYNVTGRKNPYSVFFKPNAHGELQGYMLSVFATQIPYINFNILF